LTSVSTLLISVGLPKQAGYGGERRLVARLAAVALDGVHQRGLLAADVGAGAPTQLEVEGEPAAHHVTAQESAGPRLLDGVDEAPGGQRVLAADVEVAEFAVRQVGL